MRVNVPLRAKVREPAARVPRLVRGRGRSRSRGRIRGRGRARARGRGRGRGRVRPLAPRLELVSHAAAE